LRRRVCLSIHLQHLSLCLPETRRDVTRRIVTCRGPSAPCPFGRRRGGDHRTHRPTSAAAARPTSRRAPRGPRRNSAQVAGSGRGERRHTNSSRSLPSGRPDRQDLPLALTARASLKRHPGTTSSSVRVPARGVPQEDAGPTVPVLLSCACSCRRPCRRRSGPWVNMDTTEPGVGGGGSRNGSVRRRRPVEGPGVVVAGRVGTDA
jgi:hypothetical protein